MYGSTGPFASGVDTISQDMKLTLCGTLADGVYKSIVSVTGSPGVLYQVTVYSNSAGTLPIDVQIILDGITLGTWTGLDVTNVGDGVIAIGSYYGPQPTPFTNSFDIQIRSTGASTDDFTVGTIFTTT
jgi:hypothetical protein